VIKQRVLSPLRLRRSRTPSRPDLELIDDHVAAVAAAVVVVAAAVAVVVVVEAVCSRVVAESQLDNWDKVVTTFLSLSPTACRNKLERLSL
jgi:hypothetical protein